MFQTLSLTKGYANQPDKWNKQKKKLREEIPPLPSPLPKLKMSTHCWLFENPA